MFLLQKLGSGVFWRWRASIWGDLKVFLDSRIEIPPKHAFWQREIWNLDLWNRSAGMYCIKQEKTFPAILNLESTWTHVTENSQVCTGFKLRISPCSSLRSVGSESCHATAAVAHGDSSPWPPWWPSSGCSDRNGAGPAECRFLLRHVGPASGPACTMDARGLKLWFISFFHICFIVLLERQMVPDFFSTSQRPGSMVLICNFSRIEWLEESVTRWPFRLEGCWAVV